MISPRLLLLALVGFLAVGSASTFFLLHWRPPLAAPPTIGEEPFVPCAANAARLVEIPIPDQSAWDDAPVTAVPVSLPKEFETAVAAPPPFVVTMDRFRGPRWGLHRDDYRAFEGNRMIELTLIVGERGDIVFALPTAGPRELFAQAIGLAKRWKVDPILRDGKPVMARLEKVQLAVQEPEHRPPSAPPLPQVVDWRSSRIRYDEHPVGGVRDFVVEIRGDGVVTYLGREGVALKGRHCARVSRAAVERLVDAFRRAEFLRLHNEYEAEISHAPSIRLAIEFDSTKKTVHDFLGAGAAMPDAVTFLEYLTLETAGAQRWTKGDAGTAPALAAEDWNFRRSDAANRSIIAGAALYGDLAAVNGLIAAGAPVVDDKPQFVRDWIFPGDDPLTNAADQGAFSVVNVLLAAKANWSKSSLGRALVAGSRFGNADFLRSMLARGADVQAQNDSHKSALMGASESGVPEAVSVLIAAGADVYAADDEGQNVLHWVGKQAPINRLEPAAMNRAAVVALLVRAGARVDAPNTYGHTPL